MDLATLVTAVGAGVVYVVTPGPATLAALGLAAAHGRGRALRFFAGHAVGDFFWSVMALAALVGASRLGPTLFHLLGLACGAYLVVLGVRALVARGGGDTAPVAAESPVRTGVVFGLTNPKAYPFSLAMYGALAVGTGGADLAAGEAVALFLATSAGMAIGTLVTVGWAGLGAVRRVFMRFRAVIGRCMGGLFVAFGVATIAESGRALAR